MRDASALVAAAIRALSRRDTSERVPMRGGELVVNMSETGQADSHSVSEMAGGRLALKLRRRKNMAPVAILVRSRRREGHDPQGEDSHVPQLLCPTSPSRPILRERVVAGELISPSAQSRHIIRPLD